jgi:hypothetical protein
MTAREFTDYEGITRVWPGRTAAEYANRWALSHGLPVPYPDLRDARPAQVPATWGKRRIEQERAAEARQLARHRISCSQCAAARGDLTRGCDDGYSLARSVARLTDAWWQAKGREPADSPQGALW